MDRFKSKFFHYINRNFQFINTGERFEIAIIDDVFPFPISPWRNLEYLSIAENFKTVIFSDGVEYNLNLPFRKKYEEFLKDYNYTFPNNKITARKLKLLSPLNADLLYLLFYGYVKRYFPHVEKHKLRLGFTLYPGGGLDVSNKDVVKNLRKIVNYKGFAGVIVNQNFTRDFLINEVRAEPSQIRLIKQPMILPEYLKVNPFEKKRWFGIHKSTFDIAFVANKYTVRGLDKGFDTLQDVALEILKTKGFIRFHVVGGFSENDIVYPELKKYFTFYGFRDFNFFESFYKNIDIFISPNKPFTSGGIFDGFPLGTSYEAGICGAVLLMTDYLNENEVFVDKIDYFNINQGKEEIIEKFTFLIENPILMEAIARNFIQRFFEYTKDNIGLSKRLEFMDVMLKR